MNFRFTVSIEGLGAADVAADNAEALCEAFERKHPEAGAAVGASLDERALEATFSVSAFSIGRATRKARRIFIDSAIESGIKPSPVKSVDVEIDVRAARSGRRWGRSNSWRLRRFAHTAF